jgi:hypothetical protein
VPSCILQPLWNQLQALVPARSVRHPLGCHRPRVPDRVIFDKLIQVLVLAAATAASPTPPARRPRCAAAATSGSPWVWPSSSTSSPGPDLCPFGGSMRRRSPGRPCGRSAGCRWPWGCCAPPRARPARSCRPPAARCRRCLGGSRSRAGPTIGHPGSVACYVLGVTVSLIPAFFPRIGSTVDGRCTNATQVAGSGASSRRGSPVAL